MVSERHFLLDRASRHSDPGTLTRAELIHSKGGKDRHRLTQDGTMLFMAYLTIVVGRGNTVLGKLGLLRDKGMRERGGERERSKCATVRRKVGVFEERRLSCFRRCSRATRTL